MIKANVYMPIVNKINKRSGILKLDLSQKIKHGFKKESIRIKNGYAFCSNHGEYVHRVITGCSFKIVDHKNKDKLDCRECNLRESDYSLNKANSKPHNSRKYKGVRKSWSRFRSTIVKDGKQIHLGMYDTEEEAAVAYNDAALKIYGNHAELNNV